jgi:DNA repair protein RadC
MHKWWAGAGELPLRKEFMIYCKGKKIRATGVKEVARVFRDILKLEDRIEQDKEHFYVMHLNVKSQVLMVELVNIGTLNSSLVHPRETFRRAIVAGSASIIVAHNHPSGEVEPSDEDTKITKVLFEAGQLLGITMLDHVIFARDRYFSFKENGEGEIG